ncbi:hypothetical protein [Jeotgalibaca sp. A127]|uniref:hypothetical protein n=1 Tax=Jeotgalibaca sp. A127 TaxID=3457324 RepID=UPI003FCFCC58
MERTKIIEWLLEGDVSIQYQVQRDLLAAGDEVLVPLQRRIALEGWGFEFLQRQHADGHWGRGFYQPKWTSTHYTLLDLRNLGCLPTPEISKALALIVDTRKGYDGGISCHVAVRESDLCVNGMFLNYACYFGISEEEIMSVVDFIISQQLPDGGFNCNLNVSGAKHSSMHSTLSTLEGLCEYRLQGYGYRLDELMQIEREAREFLLRHRLFRSDHTGKVIDSKYLRFPYPSRWRYDVLRALDYFVHAGVPYDERMLEAIEIVEKKQNDAGKWLLPAHYPGSAFHFEMEEPGRESRWNTLRALRVMDYFGI